MSTYLSKLNRYMAADHTPFRRWTVTVTVPLLPEPYVIEVSAASASHAEHLAAIRYEGFGATDITAEWCGDELVELIPVNPAYVQALIAATKGVTS